jgi:hypothetical protein
MKTRRKRLDPDSPEVPADFAQKAVTIDQLPPGMAKAIRESRRVRGKRKAPTSAPRLAALGGQFPIKTPGRRRRSARPRGLDKM